MPRWLVLGPHFEDQEPLRLHPRSDSTGLGNLPAPRGDGPTLPRVPLSSGLGRCRGDDRAEGGAWRGEGRDGHSAGCRALEAGMAYLPVPPAAWPARCAQAKKRPELPGVGWRPSAEGGLRALAGTASWVNIVLGFSFFLFKQALPSAGHITLNKASQCC